MNKDTTAHSDGLFHHGETHYFTALEKLALPLRQTAREMTTFITNLKHSSSELQDLKKAYATLESTPVKEIYKGLELVASHLTKVNFLEPEPTMDIPDFIGFMTIQNQISAQVNELMTHAMRHKN